MLLDPLSILLAEARILGLVRLTNLLDPPPEPYDGAEAQALAEVTLAMTSTRTVLRLRRGAKPGEALSADVTPEASAEADRLSAEATEHLIRAEQLLSAKANPCLASSVPS